MIQIIIMVLLAIINSAVWFGLGWFLRLKKIKISEVTIETSINGRIFKSGFSYDHRKDCNENKFNEMTQRLCKSIEKTFLSYDVKKTNLSILDLWTKDFIDEDSARKCFEKLISIGNQEDITI